MATDPQQPPIDDRVIMFTVRYRQEGPNVEGGFNAFWAHLPKDKKRALFYAAIEALAVCGAQMIGDDEMVTEMLAMHEKGTH